MPTMPTTRANWEESYRDAMYRPDAAEDDTAGVGGAVRPSLPATPAVRAIIIEVVGVTGVLKGRGRGRGRWLLPAAAVPPARGPRPWVLGEGGGWRAP